MPDIPLQLSTTPPDMLTGSAAYNRLPEKIPEIPEKIFCSFTGFLYICITEKTMNRNKKEE